MNCFSIYQKKNNLSKNNNKILNKLKKLKGELLWVFKLPTN